LLKKSETWTNARESDNFKHDFMKGGAAAVAMKKMLSEQVANDIVEMITIEKRFRVGDKLPNEYELSKMLGVSRTTLRDAIRFLVAHNILEVCRGRGTFVANNQDLCKDDGYGGLEHIHPQAKDAYEVRLMLEPLIARLATERATERELEKILEYGEVAGEKQKKNQNYYIEEQQFHNAITKATHNDFLTQLLPIINRGVWSITHSERITQENIQQSVQIRALLLECLRQRNSAGAESAMRLHIILGMMKTEAATDADQFLPFSFHPK